MLNLLIRIICKIGKLADGDESLEAKEKEFWERMKEKYGDEMDEYMD